MIPAAGSALKGEFEGRRTGFSPKTAASKELLAHLGVKPGQRLDVEVLPGRRLELHAEQATGTIAGFIGRLAGRSSQRASLQELQEAIESGCIASTPATASSPSKRCWPDPVASG